MKLPLLLISLILTVVLLGFPAFLIAGKLNLLPYSEVRIVSHWEDSHSANVYYLQKKCLGVWFSVQHDWFRPFVDDWQLHYHCEIINGDKPKKEEPK